MKRRQALGSIASGAAMIAISGLRARRAVAGEFPIVETHHGKVRGFLNRDVFTFRGVRYGAATGGANRFLPPVPPEPWAGVRDATSYGYSAPQTNPDPKGPAQPPEMAQLFATSNGFRANPAENEDCLFLNVWTHGLGADRKRPVVVWLHGGGYSSGSASELLYDGTNMVRRGDVVFVGVNHRLNVFGYTHFGDIGGKEFTASGNTGQLDIIQALGWVRDNIDRFGGDPARVMIFGESGGGSKVSYLLASPQAQGLFHRAVIQSGPGIRMGDRAAATRAAELLLAELGLEPARLRDIQQLPTQRVLAAYFAVQTKLPAGGLGSGAFNPVLDPVLMPAHPFEPTASPLSADVPVIVGSNRTEATLFAMRDPEAFALDEAKLLERVRRRFPKDAERVIRAYREPGASPSDVYFRIETDQTFGNNSALLAERKAALGRAPTFLYRFDWPTPILDGRLGSPHGIEMPFVFDNIDEGGIGLTGGGEAANRLAARVCATWIAFAETGRPDSAESGLPHWPAYDARDRATMLFNEDSQVVHDPQGSVRKLFANLSRA